MNIYLNGKSQKITYTLTRYSNMQKVFHAMANFGGLLLSLLTMATVFFS